MNTNNKNLRLQWREVLSTVIEHTEDLIKKSDKIYVSELEAFVNKF